MNVNKNFYADWVDLLRDILVNYWGYDATEVRRIDNEKLPIHYFNAEQRRVESTSRTIKYSDVFHCPAELNSGWELLKNKMESGNDLAPHLSKFVSLIDKTDPMLNDWKIHHFHLGTELEGNYIKRTGPLVFAYVTNDEIYVVNIFSHGQWENTDIVEIIHRNWPHLIEQFKLKGVKRMAYEPTIQDRKQLRKVNANSFVTVTDGTVYAPIGGGSSSAGFNINSAMNLIRQKKLLSDLEGMLDSNIANIVPQLLNEGYDGVSDLNVSLVIEGRGYHAVFNELNCSMQFPI
ncbi:hypothetical protein [Vibrio splendidus]|uniref:hypothetical protein n=1 Tax=Vibrio splendidus TaxID=29497 RepID=UPI0011B5C397|nr:hypothetical protein [Vibrio splendidus]